MGWTALDDKRFVIIITIIPKMIIIYVIILILTITIIFTPHIMVIFLWPGGAPLCRLGGKVVKQNLSAS